jgi:SAM-dependent methyltransferase
MRKEEIRRHFEAVASDYDRWKEKSSYYYGLLAEIYRELVPPGRSVLEVGCGTGTLLSRLRPRRGVGIDNSPRMVEIAAAKFPDLSFAVGDAENLDLGETFDFVIVPDVVEHLSDVGAMFRSVRGCCREDSRVIVTSVNPLWAPVLHMAERLGLKMPEGEHRWLPERRLLALAREAGFTAVNVHGRILCPKNIHVVSGLLNRAAARVKTLRPLCLLMVLDLAPETKDNPSEGSATRAEREIAHGRILAQGDPESLWGWKTPAGRERARRRAGLIAQGAALAPGVLALEIGCGTGHFTEMFAATGARIVAVDISGDLLSKALSRDLPADRVRFLEKRFEECEVDGPFDAVIGSSVLHHLEIEEALAKIHGLLKPGGRMSFAEPNMLNPQVFVERKFTFLRPWLSYVSPDETAFVRWKLADALAKAGFAEVEIAPFDWLHPSTPEPLIRLTDGMGRVMERTPLVREFAGSLHIRCLRPS